MKEAEATAEAVEVAMEAAVAEPERLQTAEGAVNGALQGMALQATMCAQVWLLAHEDEVHARQEGRRRARLWRDCRPPSPRRWEAAGFDPGSV